MIGHHRARPRRRRTTATVVSSSVLAAALLASAPANASILTGTGKDVTVHDSHVAVHCSLTVQSLSADGQYENVKIGLDAKPSNLAGYFTNVWTQAHCFVNVSFAGDVEDFVVSRSSATIAATALYTTIATPPPSVYVQICAEGSVVLKNGDQTQTGQSCS